MSINDAFRRAFVENAALKIVALLLSVTLFIVVHGDKDTVISFTLKVGYTEPSDRVLVSPMIDEVRVTVKGPWTRIKRFDDRSVEPLRVDLSRLTDGEFAFQQDMIHLPPGMRVASINPPSVSLRFENTATRIIAVTPQLLGDPSRGFRVERRAAAPSHVMVRGAKSVVDAMTEVRTHAVSVVDKQESFRARVELEQPEGHVTIVDAPTIEVEVAITEETGNLTLADVPVQVHAPAGVIWQDAHVTPATVKIVLRGSRNAIETVVRARVTAEVDASVADLGGTREAEVIVEGLPPGVAVAVEPRRVTLTVK